MSIPSAEMLVSKYHFPLKQTRKLWEMAGSSFGAEKIISWSLNILWEQKLGKQSNTCEGVSKFFRSQHEGASTTWNLSFKKNKNVNSSKYFKYMSVYECLMEACFQHPLMI